MITEEGKKWATRPFMKTCKGELPDQKIKELIGYIHEFAKK